MGHFTTKADKGFTYCHLCGKVAYPTRFKAKKQARYATRNDVTSTTTRRGSREIREYQCPHGHGFHIGHQSRARRRGMAA